MSTDSNTYSLTGLHCQACVKRVQAALAPLAKEVTVTLDPMQVKLVGAHADFAQLQAAVASAGQYALQQPVAENFGQKMPLAVVSIASDAIKTIAKEEPQKTWLQTYRPLLLILGYILAASVLVQIGSPGQVQADETMRLFMAGFFLVFSFFKMLDLKAFADAYAGYDLLAARWSAWGLAYPFVELGLGVAYLTNWQPVFTNGVTLLVMGFSAIGVIRAVRDQRRIRCACLGTVFQLPMSTVTIVEDVGMVLMAGLALV
jgi:copper chaperone CopZ